jgi:hypothetical protein
MNAGSEQCRANQRQSYYHFHNNRSRLRVTNFGGLTRILLVKPNASYIILKPTIE